MLKENKHVKAALFLVSLTFFFFKFVLSLPARADLAKVGKLLYKFVIINAK